MNSIQKFGFAMLCVYAIAPLVNDFFAIQFGFRLA